MNQWLIYLKIFVGLGFPYEGPAPLEAIADGAVFLNPVFEEGSVLFQAADKFFKVSLNFFNFIWGRLNKNHCKNIMFRSCYFSLVNVKKNFFYIKPVTNWALCKSTLFKAYFIKERFWFIDVLTSHILEIKKSLLGSNLMFIFLSLIHTPISPNIFSCIPEEKNLSRNWLSRDVI